MYFFKKYNNEKEGSNGMSTKPLIHVTKRLSIKKSISMRISPKPSLVLSAVALIKQTT